MNTINLYIYRFRCLYRNLREFSWTQNTGYPETRIEAGTGDGPNMEREHEFFFSLELDGSWKATLKVVVLMKCFSVIHIDVCFIKSKCTKERTFKKKGY